MDAKKKTIDQAMFTEKPKPNSSANLCLSSLSRLVLFDIDQTMVTYAGATRKAMFKALEKSLKINTNQSEMAKLRMSGKTDPQIIREFILTAGGGVDFNEYDWQKAIDYTLDLYLQFLPDEIDEAIKTSKAFMYEGVLEILSLLEKDKRISLAILTGNVEKGARLKLEHFGLNRFFPIGAYGCDSASRLDLPAIAHKRAQEHYRLKWTPGEIIVIGDAENDILCAQHYGAVSLAINTGHTTWQELSALKPNYLYSSLSNTEQILSAILAESVPVTR